MGRRQIPPQRHRVSSLATGSLAERAGIPQRSPTASSWSRPNGAGTNDRGQPQAVADRRSGADRPHLSEGEAARPDPSARGRVRLRRRRRSANHCGAAGHRRPSRLRGVLGRVAIHRAFGARVLGCVMNGSFRELDMIAPGFQIIGGRIGPSHAHVHMAKCVAT
jgi:hypothetical protein